MREARLPHRRGRASNGLILDAVCRQGCALRRILILLLVLAAPVASSWAADKSKPVTVDQLDQWLAKNGRKADDKVASDLGKMELTERVSSAQLARWQAGLPGTESRAALDGLVGLSAFQPLPQAGMLSDAPPDLKAQGAIVSRAIDYVLQTLHRLPDLYATRSTEHFEDTPGYTEVESEVGCGNNQCSPTNPVMSDREEIPYQPLHRIGQSSVVVSYRNGAEVRGAVTMDRNLIDQAQSGFTTAGEFGPILSVVLNDAMHGTITWGYWEQGAQGKVAVFRYSVPQSKSNYVVAIKHGADVEKLVPAYHGEIAIDPASGAILRISILSDTTSEDIKASEIAVQYGPVTLGGIDYICPVKSEALLKSLVKLPHKGLLTELSEVTFTGYHLFRADMKILPPPQ